MIKNKDEIVRLARENALEIIRAYVELKRTGSTHSGLCPFHTEKTPSFHVYSSSGSYKCYGCGVGGDPINFLREHEGMTFVEACEYVARQCGISVEYVSGQNRLEAITQDREKKQLAEVQQITLQKAYEILRSVGLPYTAIGPRYSLLEGKNVTYDIDVDGRYYRREIVQRFGLAYAKKGKEGNLLTRVHEAAGLKEPTLKALGLIRPSSSGGNYDFFGGRLLFPIRNHLGKLVGLAGRKPRADVDPKRPKYLNTQESYLFKKSEVLYGLYEARLAIRKSDLAILVEGYTDVMTCHQEGFPQAVASCGTAFTDEQASLVKRFADTLVILRDGDAAGLKATKRDVATAVKAGLKVMVAFLPKGEDPDSLLRRPDGSQRLTQILAAAEDGIVWRVMNEWDNEDAFKKEEAYRVAADLLHGLQSEVLQDSYIHTLTRKKYLGAVTKQLKNALRERIDRDLKKTKSKKLTESQTHQAMHYGIYVRDNKYYTVGGSDNSETEISNFIIEPIMLVVGREQSWRILKIINEFKRSFIIDLDSRIFSSWERFSAFIESRGNYLYNEHAKFQHHIKIKRMVMGQMKTVYPIYVMGWHQDGFFTWGNGITDQAGKFHPVDEHGVVTFGDTSYFIKAHAKIGLELKSDDEQDSMQDQRNFCYVGSPERPSILEWSRLMLDVYGPKGMMAVAFYLGSLFRSIIAPRLNGFPFLNLFGPPRSGKSFMAWSLQYPFGAKPKGPQNLRRDTEAAIERGFAWVRDAVNWLDEYNNELDTGKIEALKLAYDGKGRNKAKESYGYSTVNSPINSAGVVTGQEQMIKDAALFTRSISITVPKQKRAQAQIDAANRLRSIEQTGVLTQMTGHLQQYRQEVSDCWYEIFDDISKRWRLTAERNGVDVDDRVILNNAIPLAVWLVISQHEEFAFDFDALEEFAYDNMVTQLNDMGQEDEVGTFWKIVNFLLTDNRISYGKDIRVIQDDSITVVGPTGKVDKDVVFGEMTNLVCLNFSRLHSLYMDAHRKERSRDGQALASLYKYLEYSKGYVGWKKMRFQGATYRALIFESSELPYDFERDEY